MSWRTLKGGVCSFILLLAGPAAAQTIFTEVTKETVTGQLFVARSISFGDYDNDGWPDLFLAENQRPQVALYNNKGNGRFADWTNAIQADIPPQAKGGGSIFGDYDNDGDLEIFQAAGGSNLGLQRSLMLLNLGQGQFLDVTESVGFSALGKEGILGVGMGDIDNDGDLDLLTINGQLPKCRIHSRLVTRWQADHLCHQP